MRFHEFVAAALLLALTGCAAPVPGSGGAAQRFAEVRHSPPLLRGFLGRMPKGADLHSHLSGAAYAEGLLATGAAAGLCFDPASSTATTPPCRPGQRPLAEALGGGPLHRAVVDGWSLRSFVATPGRSGHDQFFDAFGRFGAAVEAASAAAEVVDRAAAQRMRYLELMVSFQGSQARRLGAAIPWQGDPAAFRAQLMQAGIARLVPAAQAEARAVERALREKLGCGTPAARPGCGVDVRWLAQVTRTNPPGQVAAQVLLSALLQQADERVVGLNLVAPEDHPVALADYSTHMRVLADVQAALPGTNVALHAGEVVLGLVPPEALRFHITEAVRVARARRIGHGVGVMAEDDAFALLREMAQRRVAVEVNLSSNDVILGVRGPQHPLPVYLAAGVPVVLATDDEGVARIDRTHELQRAVQEHGLDWPTLLQLERATLEYAFLPGASLWADLPATRRVDACAGADALAAPAADCAALLAASPKARLQWALERDLAAFDQEAPGLRF